MEISSQRPKRKASAILGKQERKGCAAVEASESEANEFGQSNTFLDRLVLCPNDFLRPEAARDQGFGSKQLLVALEDSLHPFGLKKKPWSNLRHLFLPGKAEVEVSALPALSGPASKSKSVQIPESSCHQLRGVAGSSLMQIWPLCCCGSL